jgi:hypothetical protein
MTLRACTQQKLFLDTSSLEWRALFALLITFLVSGCVQQELDVKKMMLTPEDFPESNFRADYNDPKPVVLASGKNIGTEIYGSLTNSRISIRQIVNVFKNEERAKKDCNISASREILIAAMNAPECNNNGLKESRCRLKGSYYQIFNNLSLGDESLVFAHFLPSQEQNTSLPRMWVAIIRLKQSCTILFISAEGPWGLDLSEVIGYIRMAERKLHL